MKDLLRQPHEFSVAVVEHGKPHVRIDDPDAVGYGVQSQAELGLFSGQLLFRMFALGDVGVGHDKAARFYGIATDLDEPAVVQSSLELVGLDLANELKAGLHLFLNVAGAIFTFLGDVAEYVLQAAARPVEVFRQRVHVDDALIVRHHVEVFIEHGDPLVHVLHGGLYDGFLAGQFRLRLRALADVGLDVHGYVVEGTRHVANFVTAVQMGHLI